MKTKAFYLFSVALLSLTLFSCSKDDDNGRLLIDYTPYNIAVSVQDAAGNDLLASGKFNDSKFEYSGTMYDIVESADAANIKTRMCAPEFYGLRKLITDDGRYVLYFGELSGDDNVTDEPITIHWGDGTTDNLSFTNKVNSKKIEIVERSIKVNGKIVEDAYKGVALNIVIVK